MDKLQILINATLAKGTSKNINDQLQALKLKSLQVPISVNTTALKKLLKDLNVQFNAANKAAGGSGSSPAVQIFDRDKLDKEGKKYFLSATNIISRIKKEYASAGDVNIIDFRNSKKEIVGFQVEVRKLTGEIEKLNFAKAQIDTGKSIQNGFVFTKSSDKDDLSGNSLQKKLDTLNRIENRLKDIRQKSFDLTKPLTEVAHVDELNKKYAAIDAEINKVRASGDAMSKAQQRNIGNMLADAERYRREMQRQEYPGTKLDPTSLSNNKTKYEADLITFEKRWKNQGVLTDQFKKKVDALKLELASVGSTDDLHKFEHNLDLTNAEAKQLLLTLRQFNVETAKDTAQSKLNAYLKANPKVLSANRTGFEALAKSIRKISNPTDASNVNKEFLRLKSSMTELSKTGDTVFGGLLKNMAKFSAWVISSGAIMAMLNTIRQVISNVVLLDTELTELKKVTSESDAVYNSFLERASKNAIKLGTNLTDLVRASAEFARTGFSLEESENLASVATIYKNVGDGINSITDSSSILISVLKAFRMEANQSLHLIDALNKVGNEYAVSSSDLGVALLKSSSALASANNTYEQTIGLIVSANEIIQDADITGTAIRTISMRLRNTAGDLQELGEDAEGAAISITKLQEQVKNLTSGKVDIMLNPQTFKSTYDIIVELSEVWGGLSDRAQADLTRLIAGNLPNALYASKCA